MPHHLGAKYAASMIMKHGLHASHFDHEKEKHIASLSGF
jgi:hypothetical protein